MKKALKIIIVLLYSNYCFSQIYYSHYYDQTSEWRSFSAGFNGAYVFETYATKYFDGTETINGFVYYKQYSKTVTNYGFPVMWSEDNLYGPTFIREDVDGKIWSLDTNNNEVLYYDNQNIINAQIGDPHPSQFNNGCLVESIETVTFDAMQLKKVLGTNTGSNSGTMEGIGDIGIPCGFIFEGVFYLNCYTKQNNTLQFGTIDCALFPMPQRQSLDLNAYSNQNFSIYPNPAKNSLTISSKQNVSISEVTIYNILGQLVETIHNSNNIDVSSLKTGNYFIKITSDKGSASSKFIKE